MDLPQVEKKAVVVHGVSALFMGLVTAGGLDAEGGIPDMDTQLFGIGAHRNIFFHSVLIGLGVEFSIRFSLALIKRLEHRIPVRDNRFWKEMISLADQVESGMVKGMWLGMFIHLLQDANLFADSTKPYAGLPFSMEMDSHQNLFAFNSLISGSFSLGKK